MLIDNATFDVRQVSQYPLITQATPFDLMLIQQNGLGGPFRSITRDGLLSGIQGIAVGGLQPSLPPFGQFPAVAGVVATFLTSPSGPSQGFNWFVDAEGFQRYLANGIASRFEFGDRGLFLGVAAVGFAGDAINAQAWTNVLHVSPAGVLKVREQIRVGRFPACDDEVATLGWIMCSVPTSFNGRVGPVCLNALDVNEALCVQPGDSLVTRFWVEDTIKLSLQAFRHQGFVWSFNGRMSDVVLTVDDVNAAFAADGADPQAPTPSPGDADNSIATTAFVANAIADLLNTVNIDLSSYALLNSPAFTGIPTAPTAAVGTATGQIATTAFVLNAVSGSTAGVSSFNTRTGAVILTQADIVNAAGWASPVLTGTPTSPTASAGDSSNLIATTAFVHAVANGGVTSFNARNGVVTLTAADVTGVGGALLAGPALTGVPTAPTAAPGTSTTQLATTAFVSAAVSAATAGVASFNGRTGAVTLIAADVSAVGGAFLASPAFSGTPTAPTASPGTNTTQLATTAFVLAQISATGGVSTFNGRSGAVTLSTADITGAGGAPLAAPTFTGIPAAPTAAPGTNTTQLATTAFVAAAVAAGAVTSFNTRTGAITLTTADVTGAGGAPLASPTFTGVPAAPTPVPGDNSTALATTAFVTAALSGGGPLNLTGWTLSLSGNISNMQATGTSGSFFNVSGSTTASNQNVIFKNHATGPIAQIIDNTSNSGLGTLNYLQLKNAVSGSAAILGVGGSDTNRSISLTPAGTGTVQAPTMAATDNSTAVATTAFVKSLPVQLTASYQGKPAAGAIVVVPIVFACVVAANLTGSSGKVVTTNPAATAAFTVAKNGTSIGTASIATTGVFTFSGAGATFAAGDWLTVTAPATQDANLTDVGISILATRS